MKKFLFITMLVLAALATSSQAATVDWDGGGGDGLWATAANWSGDAIPVVGDVANIAGGVTVTAGSYDTHWNDTTGVTVNITGNSTLVGTHAFRPKNVTFHVGTGSTLNVDSSSWFCMYTNTCLSLDSGALLAFGTLELNDNPTFRFNMDAAGYTTVAANTLRSNSVLGDITWEVDMANYTGGDATFTLIDFGTDAYGFTSASFQSCNLSILNAGGYVCALSWNDAADSVELAVVAPVLNASFPTPADGAIVVPLDTDLTWIAGASATSHDVYFGTTNPPAFIGNQATVGYDPGTMTGSTTYYWQIDETDGTTTWPGSVWSFTTLNAALASVPSPADDATGVAQGPVNISWEAGLGGVTHHIYVAESEAALATAAEYKSTTDLFSTIDEAFIPGSEVFWRVDEEDAGSVVVTGFTWSFTTYTTTDYDRWNGSGADDRWDNPDNWDAGVPGLGSDVEIDTAKPGGAALVDAGTMAGFAAMRLRGTGTALSITGGLLQQANGKNIEPSGDTTAAVIEVSGGVFNLYEIKLGDLTGWGIGTLALHQSDGVVNCAQMGMSNPAGGTGGLSHALELTGGVFNIGQIYNWNADPTIPEIYIDGGTLTRAGNQVGWADGQISVGHITSANSGRDLVVSYDDVANITSITTDPELIKAAWNPTPADGGTVVFGAPATTTQLSWSAGSAAATHNIYFGTSEADVNDSATAKVTGQLVGNTTYTATVALGGSYMWRIDEVDSGSAVTTGPVWSFSVASYISIEDFESYDDDGDLIGTWIDGYGGGNGGVVYLSIAPDPAIDTKAMKLAYDNDGSIDPEGLTHYTTSNLFSEAYAEPSLSDMDMGGDLAAIDIMIKGDPCNSAEQIYVVFDDGSNEAILYMADTSATQNGGWAHWFINPADLLADNPSLLMSSINEITVGVGERGDTTTGGGAGTIYVDNIRLIVGCIPSFAPNADIDNDCDVDIDDFAILAAEWLTTPPLADAGERLEWNFDMSADPVGAGAMELNVRTAGTESNYSMTGVDTMIVAGDLCLDQNTDTSSVGCDSGLRWVVKALDSIVGDGTATGSNIWFTLASSQSTGEQCSLGATVAQADGGTQTAYLWTGNPPHVAPWDPVVVAGFDGTAFMDIQINYEWATDTYDWVITDGTLTQSGSDVSYHYLANNSGDGGSFTVHGGSSAASFETDLLNVVVGGSLIVGPQADIYPVDVNGDVVGDGKVDFSDLGEMVDQWSN